MIPSEVFGGNSDGSVAMFEWLDLMCPGCRHARYPNGRHEGVSCRLGHDLQALVFPHEDREVWSPDACTTDEAVSRLDDPDMVRAWCFDRVPRARRSDAGKRRGPRPAPRQAMFPMEVDG